MSAIPGPVTHPPGMHHPFDPINCSSDAGWQQQQMMQQALAHEHIAAQARRAHEPMTAQARDYEAASRQREDDLLLLLG